MKTNKTVNKIALTCKVRCTSFYCASQMYFWQIEHLRQLCQTGTIFPTAFADFVSLCHILVILTLFQTFKMISSGCCGDLSLGIFGKSTTLGIFGKSTTLGIFGKSTTCQRFR